MWKYRNRGIFVEWNRAAFWIAFFVWLLTGFVIFGLEMRDPEQTLPKAAYVLPFVLAAAVILVRAIFFRKELHEDDEYLAKAVPPEWRRLPPDSGIIPKMQEACKTHIIGWLVLAVILLPGTIWVDVRNLFDWKELRISLLILVPLALVIVIHLLRWRFWLHPPIELEYTAIDVAYCEEHNYLVNNGGRRKDISLYYFLPGGRYRVVLHNQEIGRNPPGSVYFVRLYGIVRWIHWGD